ncbi:MAG: hypothetical protein IKR57_03860 [Bacilli bacterium]|nr:hypothetical protein [Bacilli bacterium]
MKNYKVGFMCSIILIIAFIGMTVYEAIGMLKMDKQVISTDVKSDCKHGNMGDDQAYECDVEYTFIYEDKLFTCKKYDSSAIKKNYSNEKIYFSSKNPNDCSVGKKSNYLMPLVILDFISIVIMFILRIAKNRNNRK